MEKNWGTQAQRPRGSVGRKKGTKGKRGTWSKRFYSISGSLVSWPPVTSLISSSILLLPCSALLTLASYSSNTPAMFLPQDICTCFSSAWRTHPTSGPVSSFSSNIFSVGPSQSPLFKTATTSFLLYFLTYHLSPCHAIYLILAPSSASHHNYYKSRRYLFCSLHPQCLE